MDSLFVGLFLALVSSERRKICVTLWLPMFSYSWRCLVDCALKKILVVRIEQFIFFNGVIFAVMDTTFEIVHVYFKPVREAARLVRCLLHNLDVNVDRCLVASLALC